MVFPLTRKVGYLILAILILPGLGFSLPEYAMRYQQNCALCHVNPTGGGMRTLYGAQFFSYTDLPWKPLDFAEIENIKPNLNDNVQIGFDYRSLYYATDEGDNSFLAMQGDFYLAYSLGDKTQVYFDKSFIGSNLEIFALFQGLPMWGAVRAGRFMPTYGWRMEDHKTFSRAFTGFGGPAGATGYEDGVELMFTPEGGDVSLAVTNGGVSIDGNQGKALTARALRRMKLGRMNLSFGGSYRYAELGIPDPATRMAGVFGGFHYGKFSYLGEIDVKTGGAPASMSGFAVSNEFRYQLQQGIYLNAYYDFLDPDIDLQTGTQQRIKLGAELIPRGYLRLLPAVELNSMDSGAGGPSSNVLTAELQLHLWF